MPYGSGRTGKPGNVAGASASGRGTAGNMEGTPHPCRQPGSMAQSSSIAGRSLRPGNDTSLKIPSNAAGSMQSGTGTLDTSGIPSRTPGKFDYNKSKGLLKR